MFNLNIFFMAISIIELQKKFSLFNVGDKRQGVIVSEVNGEIQVKLQGGALGFINANNLDFYKRSGINLSVGRGFEFEISDIKSGIPYLILSAEYIFANSYHKARVRFSGTQGVVVEFDWNKALNIGFYNPVLGLPDEFTVLEENTPVVCKGLTPRQDFYEVDTMQLDELPENIEEEASDEVDDTEFDFPSKWNDDEVRQYIKDHGGFLSKGAYKVGECYIASIVRGQLIKFKDDSKATIKQKADNQLQPIEGDKVVVRLLKIYDFGDMKEVELLNIVDEKYCRWFSKKQNKQFLPECADAKQKNRHSVIDSGFVFGQRDDSVFNEGKKNGSEISFERYWLGFLYKAKVKNRYPVLLDNLAQPIQITLVENPDYSVLSDEDIVFVRLLFIKKEGTSVHFTMRVEFERAYKPEDDSYFIA